MALTCRFLGFSRPALAAAADYLIQRYRHAAAADMSRAIVVLPGRRAARRLLEVLVQATCEQGLALTPPTLVTVGRLPEQLYQAQRPFADPLTQQLVWAHVLRNADRRQLAQMAAAPPGADDLAGWLDLAQHLGRLHVELAADLLDFRDVARRGRELEAFDEHDRWAALRQLQEAYLSRLDALQLWDVQTARLVAIQQRECRTDREIIVLGAVDMPRSLRQMLEQVAAQVEILIHAPVEWAERFDGDGCLIPAAWEAASIGLDADQVHVVAGPADAADAIARRLAEWGGRYRADEISIGLADEKMAGRVRRQLDACGIAARSAVGTAVVETAPYRLLAAVEACLHSDRYAELAALVRHPDVSAWIDAGGVAADWLERLDQFFGRHLPARLDGDLLEPGIGDSAVRQVQARVESLLLRFRGPPRPWPDWNDAIRQTLVELYAGRRWDREREADRVYLEVFDQIRQALTCVELIPADLAPAITAETAIRLTLRQLDTANVSSRFDPEAIELLGWLELPLDDAPALMVCSLCEGVVPSSVNADAFLPNALRSQLGVRDNARRYARDAYALSVLAATHRPLELIVTRHNDAGDPLLPSRLLFATEPAEIARRARRFFATPPARHELPPLAGRITMPAADAGLVTPRPRSLDEPIRELSVTAFRDYLACPYRFYLRRVLRLRACDDAAEELDGGAFGSLIHEVLRQFGNGSAAESSDVEQIRADLHQRLEQCAKDQFGRHAMASVRVQLEQIRLRLDAFADVQAQRTAAGWKIESTEGAQQDHTDATLQVDGRPLVLRGRIDRIDVHRQTGQRAILDYKSSDSARTPEQFHQRGGEWIDLQLPLYRHLARSLGIDGPLQLGYVLLPKDPTQVEFRMAEWSESDLAAADEVARQVVRSIWQEVFWPPTDPPPDFSDDLAAICQDGVFERKLAVDDRGAAPAE